MKKLVIAGVFLLAPMVGGAQCAKARVSVESVRDAVRNGAHDYTAVIVNGDTVTQRVHVYWSRLGGTLSSGQGSLNVRAGSRTEVPLTRGAAAVNPERLVDRSGTGPSVSVRDCSAIAPPNPPAGGGAVM